MVHERRADLELLRVLDAILAEGGVTRAAERLNLSQSAISHSLARLRLMFGDQLLTREGRKLVPTPLARELVAPLRQGLEALDRLVAGAGRFDPATSEAQFTISLRDPTETLMLPAIMGRIARAGRGIDLRTVQVRRRNVESALATGAVSLAIDIALPLTDSVRRQKISAERPVVVMRRGHPALRKALTLDRYLEQDHIMVTSRRQGPALEDVELSKRGLSRRVRLRCRNYLAGLRAAAASDLVLTMAERYAPILSDGLKTETVAFPFRMPTLDLYLYWHASADGDAANRWLRGLVVEAFRDG
jgi:DNA-binding transcriptional LysR family regulator